MYGSILVATDGSDLALKAVEHAGKLARGLGARLTIVTVTEPLPTFDAAELGWSVPATIYTDLRKANAEKSRAILKKAAAASGVQADTVHIEDEAPFEGVIKAARQCSADLIVMGSHGYRGLERLVIGSQAAKVLNLAKVPVLVIKA